MTDETALRILTTIARARSGEPPPDLTGLRDALINEFDIAPPATRVSSGDLARQALLVLAEDPDTRQLTWLLVSPLTGPSLRPSRSITSKVH